MRTCTSCGDLFPGGHYKCPRCLHMEQEQKRWEEEDRRRQAEQQQRHLDSIANAARSHSSQSQPQPTQSHGVSGGNELEGCLTAFFGWVFATEKPYERKLRKEKQSNAGSMVILMLLAAVIGVSIYKGKFKPGEYLDRARNANPPPTGAPAPAHASPPQQPPRTPPPSEAIGSTANDGQTRTRTRSPQAEDSQTPEVNPLAHVHPRQRYRFRATGSVPFDELVMEVESVDQTVSGLVVHHTVRHLKDGQEVAPPRRDVWKLAVAEEALRQLKQGEGATFVGSETATCGGVTFALLGAKATSSAAQGGKTMTTWVPTVSDYPTFPPFYRLESDEARIELVEIQDGQ